MVVATGILEIRIHESRSLKDKRGVLRSIIKRVQNKFSISIAEVGKMDHWKEGQIGFALVGSDVSYITARADGILAFIEDLCLADIVRSDIEIMSLSQKEAPYHQKLNRHDVEKI